MIRISRADLDTIEQAAETAYPAECCGLLVGKHDAADVIQISRVVPSPNLKAVERQDRFEVDPKVRFDLMRAIDGTDERIVGHYHSHPDHPAQPSSTDRDMIWEPELIWLITSVANGVATETRAHQPTPDGNAFSPLDLETETP